MDFASPKELPPPFRARFTPNLMALFVDSESGLGYSGVLARCCAWGLCVRALNDRFYFVGAFIRIQLVSP